VGSLAICSGLTTLQLVGFKAGSSSRELLRGVSKLQDLHELELAGSLLQARQLLPLMACTALTRLCLASNNLGNIDAAAVAANAAGGGDDDGSSSGAAVLLQLLPALQQLQELDVSGCRVHLQQVYCLTRLTSLHAGAHRFRFHPNLVTSADLFGISRLQRELRALDLSCNQLDCRALQHLSQLVLLTSLNLAENELGCESGSAGAAAAATDNTAGATAAAAAMDSTAGEAAAAAKAGCPLAFNIGSTAEQAAAGSGSSPSGLQFLARMQQLQQLDLSSCGLQDVTPLVHLAGELAQ
jgi:Leucine-rich repeat (LRR) protein